MAGKSLNDLNFNTTPLPTESDPRDSDWYQFSQEIEDLLATGKATFAEDTLRGIQETVEAHHRVTIGQKQAVRNVEIAIERSRDRPRSGSRRYEGFR